MVSPTMTLTIVVWFALALHRNITVHVTKFHLVPLYIPLLSIHAKANVASRLNVLVAHHYQLNRYIIVRCGD